MRAAPASLLPLIFVGLLAGLTYWLDRTTATEEKAKKAAARHDPDFIVEQFTVTNQGRSTQSHAPSHAHAEEARASARPPVKGGIKALQAKVTSAAKSYLSSGNAALKNDWNEF